jgi:3-isopropylmalate/(R)-2-methylmalate dehydratase small subunit
VYQNEKTIDFDIDEFRKKCLIEGLDDIGLTLKKNNKIDIHEEKIHSIQPWIV